MANDVVDRISGTSRAGLFGLFPQGILLPLSPLSVKFDSDFAKACFGPPAANADLIVPIAEC